MFKTKLETVIFERRDAVRRNLSMLVEKVEDFVSDHYLKYPDNHYIRVDLHKVVTKTGFTAGQLERNLDIIYTGLLDKGWDATLYVDDESNYQYLIVSV